MAVCRDRARRRPIDRCGHRRWAGAIVLGALVVLPSAAPDASAPDGDPIELSPETATFGDVVLDESAELTIVARNVTVTVVGIAEVVLAPGSDAFSILGDPCPDELLPGATCDVTVAFQPTTNGDDATTVRVVTSGGTVEAHLSGRGVGGETAPPQTVGPTVAPTVAPTSVAPTVAPTVTTPATSPTVVTPPVDASDAARLADCEVRARQATISYDTARSMTVDQTQQFVVTATIQGSVPAGTTTTSVAPDVTVVAVALRCEVQAQLRGADFRVDPADFQPRSFLDQPSVEWSWDVVPLKAGTSVLNLEIRSVAVIDGRRIEGAGTQLYQSTVTITTKDQGLGADITRWTSSVVDFPLVRGLGSLLVALGALAAAWRWILKRPWPWRRGDSSASAGRPKRDP